LIEHGFTSAPTQYRLYGRRFLQVFIGVIQQNSEALRVVHTRSSLSQKVMYFLRNMYYFK